MLKITQPRQRRLIEDFRLDFINKEHPSSGYSFSCSENGIIDESKLNPTSRESLAYCRAHPELYHGPEFMDCSRKVIEPAQGNCPHCGTVVFLTGDVSCSGCGQWFNAVGQELVPPREWGEDTRERFDDFGNCIYSPMD